MEAQLSEKEKELWKIAKDRVYFKRHLVTYIVINTLLWCLWFISENNDEESRFPWPMWPTLGWGIGLAFSYAGAYIYPKSTAIEKEFEKLKNRA